MSGRAATDSVIPGLHGLSVGAAHRQFPSHWIQIPLLDIARLESGHTPSRKNSEWWGGDIPWISIPDARDHHGRVIHDTKSTTNEAGLSNSAARLLPTDTVCLSRTASVGYVTVLGRPMATSQDFVNWICSEAVDPHWLKHLFIAEEYALKKRFGKGSTHTTIYYPEVKAFHVCLPPVPEQRRIVSKIESLESHREAAQEALEAIPPLLEKFRQSVLAAAFRGDLTREWRAQNPDVEPASVLLERIRTERKARFIEDAAETARAKAEAKARDAGKPWGDADDQEMLEKERAKAEKKYKEPEPVDATDLPELPEGWCWARLDHCGDWSSGGTPSRGNSDYYGGDIPWLKTGELHDDWIHSAEEHITEAALRESSAKLFPAGTLLIAMYGVTIGRVGRLAIPAATNQACAAVLPEADSIIARDFLFWFFLSSRDAFRRQGQGGAQPNISQTVIKLHPIPVPPLGEQCELARVCEARFDAIADLSNTYDSVMKVHAQLSQSILAKAFRGELVPQDPNDEPASVLLERIRTERAETDAQAKPKKKAARKATKKTTRKKNSAKASS